MRRNKLLRICGTSFLNIISNGLYNILGSFYSQNVCKMTKQWRTISIAIVEVKFLDFFLNLLLLPRRSRMSYFFFTSKCDKERL